MKLSMNSSNQNILMFRKFLSVALIFGPSGSGKSVLLVSLILDIYRDVFSRVFVFSPSVNHDSIWLPVKKYVKDELKANEEKEQCFFEEYKTEDLMKIIDTQTKITKYLKRKETL